MFISQGAVYQYKCVTFDFHHYLGPIILNRKTGKERPWRSVSRRQWVMFDKWFKLSAEQREQYRVY